MKVSSRSRSMRSARFLLLPLLFAAFALPGTQALNPPVAVAAECAGDECQVPPPAPEDPIPGTAVVEGPPNQPVHYPVVHKKNPHKKHPHKGHRGDGKGKGKGGKK